MIRCIIDQTPTTNDASRDTGWTLGVYDGDNHNLMLTSGSQSYANLDSPVGLVRRFFAPHGGGWHIPPEARPETVELVIRYLDGQITTEEIR